MSCRWATTIHVTGAYLLSRRGEFLSPDERFLLWTRGLARAQVCEYLCSARRRASRAETSSSLWLCGTSSLWIALSSASTGDVFGIASIDLRSRLCGRRSKPSPRRRPQVEGHRSLRYRPRSSPIQSPRVDVRYDLSYGNTMPIDPWLAVPCARVLTI